MDLDTARVRRVEDRRPGEGRKHLRESIRLLAPMMERGTLCESQRLLSQLLLAQGRIDEAEKYALAGRDTVSAEDQTSRATTRVALAQVRAHRAVTTKLMRCSRGCRDRARQRALPNIARRLAALRGVLASARPRRRRRRARAAAGRARSHGRVELLADRLVRRLVGRFGDQPSRGARSPSAPRPAERRAASPPRTAGAASSRSDSRTRCPRSGCGREPPGGRTASAPARMSRRQARP